MGQLVYAIFITINHTSLVVEIVVTWSNQKKNFKNVFYSNKILIVTHKKSFRVSRTFQGQIHETNLIVLKVTM